MSLPKLLVCYVTLLWAKSCFPPDGRHEAADRSSDGDAREQELSRLSSTTDKGGGKRAADTHMQKHSIKHYIPSEFSECSGCDKSEHMLFDIFLFLLQCRVSPRLKYG